MTKLLYNPTTDTISRYPRADDEPVVGLDPSLVVLTEILPEQPSYDAETQYLEQTREINLEAGTLTRGWLIRDRPPVEPAPPEPRWVEFGDAVIDHPGVAAVVDGAPRRLAIALGVGLGQAAQGDPKTFLAAWTAAMGAGLVTPDLAAHVAALATTYDLPAEFVAALNPPSPESDPITFPEGWNPPESPSRFTTYTAPDGSEWVYDQPRNADGTYMADDPDTEKVESALGWVPASP
jgi:hypothetical protein